MRKKVLTKAKSNTNITELELNNKKIAYEAALESIVLLKNDFYFILLYFLSRSITNL